MKVPFLKGDMLRSGFIVFLSTLLASLVAFFANIIISNVLGPEAFGSFKVIIYLFAFLPFLADLGINSTLVKYISEFGRDASKSRRLISWFLKVKASAFAVFILIVILSKDYIATYFLKDASLSYLVVAGTLIMATSYFSTFSLIALGFQSFKLYGVSQFMGSALSSILAVMLSGYGLFYMMIGWSIGPIIGNIPCIIYLFKKGGYSGFKDLDVRRIFLRFSLPVYPIDVITNLFSVIPPIMSLFFSQKLVGYYSFAFMFYYLALLIPNSLSLVLFPKVSELNGLKRFKRAKAILIKSFIYYTPIALCGVLGIFLISDWFIGAIASQYLPSVLVFKFIVSLGFVFGYNIIYSNYLKGRGKVVRYAFFMLAQNILLIMVSMFLLNIMSA